VESLNVEGSIDKISPRVAQCEDVAFLRIGNRCLDENRQSNRSSMNRRSVDIQWPWAEIRLGCNTVDG
jgi:hypothetical protein